MDPQALPPRALAGGEARSMCLGVAAVGSCGAVAGK